MLGEVLPFLAVVLVPGACCRLQQHPLWCKHRSAAYASCTLQYALQNRGLQEPVALRLFLQLTLCWGPADLGALEGHVLQKVSSSIVVVCLISAPSINPDAHRGCLRKGGRL